MPKDNTGVSNTVAKSDIKILRMDLFVFEPEQPRAQ
jgi:hypothetical protein